MRLAGRCISKGCRSECWRKARRLAWRSTATRIARCLSAPVANCKWRRCAAGGGALSEIAEALKNDRVVATSMSNLGLERVLERDGMSLARAAVGDRYVLEEMLKSANNLGGEQSGHIIFLDDSPAGDGLLTAVKVASLVSSHGSLGIAGRGFQGLSAGN